MHRCFPDLLACEPATRRYKLIPRMEEMNHHRCLGAYLVDTLRSARPNRSHKAVYTSSTS
jgi:hypothetical protein